VTSTSQDLQTRLLTLEKAHRRMRFLAIAGLSVGAVGLCLGFAFWWRATSAPQHSLRQVREELVPTQALQLQDGTGKDLGYIGVLTEEPTRFKSLSLDLAHFAVYESGRTTLTLQKLVTATIDDDGFFVGDGQPHSDRNPYVSGKWEYKSRRDRARLYPFRSRLERIQSLLSPPKGRSFGDDDTVPTEDLRLRDRNGWQFATLGLDSRGNPSIAFADSKSVVRLVWQVIDPDRKMFPGAGPTWWDFVGRAKSD
jgi:hypothetical protein